MGRGFEPSINFYAASLTRFLENVGVWRPVLVAHSFGAAVAVELALAYPGRFPAMLLLSPAPLTGLDTPSFLYPVLEDLHHNRRALRFDLRETVRTRVPSYLEDLVDEAGLMHPAGFSGNARVLLRWNASRRVGGYMNPVLVASGYRDTIVPPSSAEATARAFPNGRYVGLGEIGHSPQIEAPEAVRYLISAMLDATNHDKGPH